MLRGQDSRNMLCLKRTCAYLHIYTHRHIMHIQHMSTMHMVNMLTKTLHMHIWHIKTLLNTESQPQYTVKIFKDRALYSTMHRKLKEHSIAEVGSPRAQAPSWQSMEDVNFRMAQLMFLAFSAAIKSQGF